MLRRAIQTVPALVQMDGGIHRVVGSTDARGHGSDFAIPHVGPFVLVGVAAGLEGPGLPPFGQHPHAGLVAVSHIAAGAWRSHSNVPGQESIGLAPDDVLVTLAGRGITHDEVTVDAGMHELAQFILRLPMAARELPAALWLSRPVTVSEGVLRVFDGALLGQANIDAVGYRICVPAGGNVALPLESAHTAGFVYARRGSVTVSGEQLGRHEVAILGAEGDALHLAAAPDAGAECIVGLGAAMQDPWAKLLGYNGFVVAGDEAAADASLRAFARDPARFGQASG